MRKKETADSTENITNIATAVSLDVPADPLKPRIAEIRATTRKIIVKMELNMVVVFKVNFKDSSSGQRRMRVTKLVSLVICTC